MSFTENLDDLVERNVSRLLSIHITWTRVPLWEVCSILNGFAFSSSRFNSENGLPLIRIRDVRSNSAATRYDGDYDDIYIVEPGELIVGMDGDFHAALWKGPTGLLNQRVCKLTPNEDHYSRKFLAHVIQGYLDAINAKTSSITVKHLSSRTVAEIPIPLPSGAEQLRIVEAIESYLTRLDDAVATLERVERNLKRYRASVLKAAVEGRLVPTEAVLARKEGRDYEPASVLLERILRERRCRWIEQAAEKGRAKAEEKAKKEGKPWTAEENAAALENERAKAVKKYKEPAAPDHEGLPELAEGWSWASVEQLAGFDKYSLTDGPFGSNLKTSHYTEAGPRVVRLQNIGDGVFIDERAHVSEEHFRSLIKHAVIAGDIVISSLGVELPRACIVPDWLGQAIVKADCLRFAPNHDLGLPSYLMYALNSRPTRKRTESLIHGVGRPRIGLTLLRGLALPLPPLSEQRRISEEVERNLSVGDQVLSEVQRLGTRGQRLRQSILKWAFEGKLAEQDPNDEPASVLLERIKFERGAMEAGRKNNCESRRKRKVK